jgi:hypothetical protein
VVNAFDRFETAIDKKLPVSVDLQKQMLRKVRDRDFGFDKAWHAKRKNWRLTPLRLHLSQHRVSS